MSYRVHNDKTGTYQDVEGYDELIRLQWKAKGEYVPRVTYTPPHDIPIWGYVNPHVMRNDFIKSTDDVIMG
jgi:hypothetical protein